MIEEQKKATSTTTKLNRVPTNHQLAWRSHAEKFLRGQQFAFGTETDNDGDFSALYCIVELEQAFE